MSKSKSLKTLFFITLQIYFLFFILTFIDSFFNIKFIYSTNAYIIISFFVVLFLDVGFYVRFNDKTKFANNFLITAFIFSQLILFILLFFGFFMSSFFIFTAISGLGFLGLFIYLNYSKEIIIGKDENYKYTKIMIIICILFFFLYLFHINYIKYIDSDEVRLMYDSYMILEGKVPFQDFQARSPILIYALSIFTYFTNASLKSYYVLAAFVNTITIFTIYAFSRKLFNEKIAVLSSVLFAISPIIVFLLWLKTQTFLLPVIIFSLLLYDKYLCSNKKKYLIGSIIMMIIAFFIREVSVVYIAGFFGLILFRKKEFKDIFNQISLVIGIFASITALYIFMTTTFFTFSNEFAVQSKFLDFDNFEIDNSSIERLYYLPFYASHYLLYLFAISTILLIFPINNLFKKRFEFNDFPQIVPFFVILALIIIYIFNAYRLGFWPQYYMEFVPFVSILISSGLVILLCKIKLVKLKFIFSFFIIVLILFSTTMGIIEMKEYKGAISRDGAIEISEQVLSLTNETDIIFAGSPVYAFLTKREHFMNLSHEYYEINYVSYVTENLIANPPKLIVKDGRIKSHYMDNEDFRNFLNRNYVEVYNTTKTAYNRTWETEIMIKIDETPWS